MARIEDEDENKVLFADALYLGLVPRNGGLVPMLEQDLYFDSFQVPKDDVLASRPLAGAPEIETSYYKLKEQLRIKKIGLVSASQLPDEDHKQ